MAKIDTSTIQGYAEMTPEQKLAALEAYNVPEQDHTGWVKKEVLDKAASDAAEWKRKYRETASDAEKQKQEGDEELNTIKSKLAEFERKDKISSAKDKYVKSGFDPDLAQSTAEAFVDGKMDVVLENLNKHTEALKEKLKDDAMKKTPAPPAGGSSSGTIDYDKEIADAIAKNDFGMAAHYSRMKTEKQNKK